MTLSETTKQVFGLAVDGYINSEKFTYNQFHAYIKSMMQPGTENCNRCIFEIALPDGKWLAKITRYGNKPDQYDYYIPDNRTQEAILKNELYGRS